MATATATATAEGQATTGTVFSGWALLSVSDIGNSVIIFERSHDSGTTWECIDSFGKNVEHNFYAPGAATEYRLRLASYRNSDGVVLRLES